MSLDRDIGWLAGALDGEGWLGLCPRQDRRNLGQGAAFLFTSGFVLGRRGKPFPMERWIRFVDGEPIPYQAEGSADVITSEGLEASSDTSARDEQSHERPAPHLKVSK
jgi:hypothetical protein